MNYDLAKDLSCGQPWREVTALMVTNVCHGAGVFLPNKIGLRIKQALAFFGERSLRGALFMDFGDVLLWVCHLATVFKSRRDP